MDQKSVDGLFERNADMRLLELRHRNGSRPPVALRDATLAFGSESVVSTTPDEPIDDAPRLRLTIAAVPQSGVIAGAVVGVAIDVCNDGVAPAPLATLLLSLPLEAEYRSGTLRVDGREPTEPERLFGSGLAIARLPGGNVTKVTFQLLVLRGIGALYLQPRLSAGGAPVVGTVGISIKRRDASAPPLAPERPFYEPEAHELADDDLGEDHILPPVLAPITAVEVAPVAVVEPAPQPKPPVEPLPEPEAKSEPEAEREREAERESEPVPVPVPTAAVAAPEPRAQRLSDAAASTATAEERMVRFRTLSANDIALLERLFATAPPGIVAHSVLISALACCDSDDDASSGAWRAFLRRDNEFLGRVLVLSRLGKPLQFTVAQSGLDELPLTWQAAPTLAKPASARRLRRELRRNEFTAMTGLLQASPRDANLRLRIALLALTGATIDGVSRRDADDALTALAAYRSGALAWLVPLCVASTSPTFALRQPPATLDAAGRRLVAVLRSAFCP